jgi:hypothetical protein
MSSSAIPDSLGTDAAITAGSENNITGLTATESEAIKLLHELPDPEVELFHQFRWRFETFHPFSRLPVELRDIILGLALPPRRRVRFVNA